MLAETTFISAEARIAQRAQMQSIVSNVRAIALRDQNQWITALHNLSTGQEIAITHAVMTGDHCAAGRLLREALQAIVLGDANDRALDEIEERFGIVEVVA